MSISDQKDDQTFKRADDSEPKSQVWFKRVGWLVLIWCVSVAGLGVIAWILRLFMEAAGLSG